MKWAHSWRIHFQSVRLLDGAVIADARYKRQPKLELMLMEADRVREPSLFVQAFVKAPHSDGIQGISLIGGRVSGVHRMACWKPCAAPSPVIVEFRSGERSFRLGQSGIDFRGASRGGQPGAASAAVGFRRWSRR